MYYWVEHYCNSYFFCIHDEDRLNSEITMAPDHNPEMQTVVSIFAAQLCSLVRCRYWFHVKPTAKLKILLSVGIT